MRILADENIPYVKQAFASFGSVKTLSGRQITRGALALTDVLVVRSVTRVDAALLEGTPVRFVATATIGEDHVDNTYLDQKGIGFASAPGCNANSVAEYVIAALLYLACSRGFQLQDRTLGIIGYGNVGKRVVQKALALGIRCVLNDPPLARETGAEKYRPLEEIYDCPLISVHVPLTAGGPDATAHLVDGLFLNRLRTGVIVLNTSRGAVIDERALLAALESGKVGAAVLDVWEDEPDIDSELLANCAIGTSHIAGYSFDGRVNGTLQVYQAACQFFDKRPVWDPSPLLPTPNVPEVRVNGAAQDVQAELFNAVRAVYDILRDDAALRAIMAAPHRERGAFFDRLRKTYPMRREFQHTRAVIEPGNAEIGRMLRGIGFQADGA
jgi:erythronate-4-phosphate dehydrogenase